MRVFLIRHGQTDMNVQRRLQGSSDTELNDVGRQQAIETRAMLEAKELIPTHVISSPLGRAIETAHLISGIPVEEVEIAQDLIEMSFGDYELKLLQDVDPTFADRFFGSPETYVPPKGGEEYDHALMRIDRFFNSFKKRIQNNEFKDQDKVFLVSHGATGHGIFEYLSKNPRKDYWKQDFNNCAVAELFLGLDGTKSGYEIVSEGFQKNW
ncbi:histidine phosphatase family protein [Butyrivibrio proteoclasticus]|uniref:histidine phosphatase family protein n=1 Tax=Butyrivibrio proteoclasticus TaxID=43305 RepID=UPI000685186E|nr:histidine phosphatase family protein [Butyrivibrio proteoclasticus]